jgi:histidine triad (HIT) family protein
MSDCVFCKISGGKISAEKIYENKNFFSIPDAHPQTEGHSLIISKNHFKTILDLHEKLGAELLDCIKKTYNELNRDNEYSGFNIVVNTHRSAGQIVEHFHLHLFPRKNDDGLNLNIKK